MEAAQRVAVLSAGQEGLFCPAWLWAQKEARNGRLFHHFFKFANIFLVIMLQLCNSCVTIAKKILYLCDKFSQIELSG
jgi:hypothetical protein